MSDLCCQFNLVFLNKVINFLISAAKGFHGFCGQRDIWAGIHGGHEHETGRIGDGGAGPGDGHAFVFHGLAHDLQHVLAKFGPFLQEKDPVMGEA